MVRGASFTSGFDVNEITKVNWFRIMQKIVSNENIFLIGSVDGLFNLEPMKLFECRSDVCMLRGE